MATNQENQRSQQGNLQGSQSRQGQRSEGSWRDNWDEVRGNLQSQHNELTDEDLNYQEGKEDELYSRVGKRLGKNRQETEDLFNETNERGMETADVERSSGSERRGSSQSTATQKGQPQQGSRQQKGQGGSKERRQENKEGQRSQKKRQEERTSR